MSILRAMVATRNACADWMTCENCTGKCALPISRSLRAIGSLAATISRSSVRLDFCTVSCRRKETEIQSRPNSVALDPGRRGSRGAGHISQHFWVAHASRVLARASSPSRTFLGAKSNGLQFSADGCGDGAEPRNQIGKNFRRERLIAVALGQLRGIVHFNH